MFTVFRINKTGLGVFKQIKIETNLDKPVLRGYKHWIQLSTSFKWFTDSGDFELHSIILYLGINRRWV